MSAFFDYDGPVIRVLNVITNLLLLNILTVLCCIPIVTAGASFTAMYYVAIKLVKQQEGYVTKDFFKSFKENFKQSTLIWIFTLIVGAVYVMDFTVFSNENLYFPAGIRAVVIILAIFVHLIVVNCFVLLARYRNSVKQTIKNAMLLMSMKFPRMLLVALCNFFPFFIFFFFPQLVILIILLGVSVPAYLAIRVYAPIFDSLEETGQEETGENEI